MSIADKLTTVADNMSKVYEAGQKSEYDKFWDSFQSNGKRTRYKNSFAGKGWNDITFKPKYNISPVGNTSSIFEQATIINLSEILQQCGVVLDTSQSTTLYRAFNYCTSLTNIPEIDTRGTTTKDALYIIFNNCSGLETIEKLILKDDGSQKFNSTFGLCPMLKNLTIEGTIGQSGFGVDSCTKLSKESIVSIFNALSPDTKELSIILSKVAVNNAFNIDVDDETTYPEGSEYYILRNSKSNWTISYC